MGEKGQALANQLEQVNRDVIGAVEQATPGQWQATCPEGWTVAAMARHIGGSYGPLSGMVQAAATRQPMPALTPEMLDQMNAQAAQQNASCTKEEALKDLREGAAGAANALRGLSDEQFSETATLPFGTQMTAEQIAQNALIGHAQGHLQSIRAAK